MLTAVPVGVAAVIGRPKPASRARKAGRPLGYARRWNGCASGYALDKQARRAHRPHITRATATVEH